MLPCNTKPLFFRQSYRCFRYEFQLFNITQPRPRMLPEPFSIPVGFKANPVPSSVLQPSQLQAKVAEKCKEAREETVARHKSYSSFNFTERPMEIDRLREEARAREEEETRYIAAKVNPPPNIPPEKQEKVRLNAAAILREDALLKKKQQQEAQSLLKYGRPRACHPCPQPPHVLQVRERAA